VPITKYATLIDKLAIDVTMPKYATHLIYLTKADRDKEVEEKIIKSIFSKKPKRADVYWFVHIHRTNQPFTLNYNVVEIVNDRIIKININAGFRVQPKVELYFKKIVQDLVDRKELNLHITPDGSTIYNDEPDFKFVVIEKFISVENEFAFSEGLLLDSYFFLKRFSISDTKAFGLDKSDVEVEYIPLIYHPIENLDLQREEEKCRTLSND
jgi:KUP system potassium uptake protein